MKIIKKKCTMKKGFTLIEILIVIAIIGILAAAVMVSTSGYRQRAVNSSFIQNVRSAQGPFVSICRADSTTSLAVVSQAMILAVIGLDSADVTVTGSCGGLVVVPTAGGRFAGTTAECKDSAGGITLNIFSGIDNRGSADCIKK